MEMELSFKNEKVNFSRIIRGSFLVAGTAIGAGMLGIPLLTAQAGFWPACLITTAVWAFMLCTGLLFLEATLWMPSGSNILSLSHKFLGTKGRNIAALLFVFLYYCLLVAYFAAGTPLFVQLIYLLTGMQLEGLFAFALFGAVFALIVFLGAKSVDLSNMVLTVGLIVSYLFLISTGAAQVDPSRLQFSDWSISVFAAPLLFSAFGYHNIIPSLCTYYEKDRSSVKWAIIGGITLALGVYLVWQWLMIGAVPKESIERARAEGQSATLALQMIAGNPWIFRIGQAFSFFAIVTSLLGVALSMVDFLADGLRRKRTGGQRALLVFLTFIPPFVLVAVDPTIFDKALGVAGGFGEAVLNGAIPILLVWMGKYVYGFTAQSRLLTSKICLGGLFLIAMTVMTLEILNLF